MEATCEYSYVCGLDAIDQHEGKCILHSENPEKDVDRFEKALEEHRSEHGADFRQMVFPAESIPFTNYRIGFYAGDSFKGVFGRGVTFHEEIGEINFEGAVFQNGVAFSNADFLGGANFEKATFEGDTHFAHATFKHVSFRGATFEGEVNFRRAEVKQEEADFLSATFNDLASFFRTEFDEGLDLSGTTVKGDAIFNQTTLGEGDFRGIDLRKDGRLYFLQVDLSKCRFLGTDLRDADFLDVRWCEEVSSDGLCFDEWFSRTGVYDEVKVEHESNGDEEKREQDDQSPWVPIERLYRQLKRNHEERGDYPRGGDFHIGEKVARRRVAWENFCSEWGVWFLLSVYRIFSKYGERALPGFLWLLFTVPAFALIYFWMGATVCPPCEPVSYCDALLSSMEATVYPVRPVGFETFWPQFSSIIQRVISPILIALLALAIRQRVKR